MVDDIVSYLYIEVVVLSTILHGECEHQGVCVVLVCLSVLTHKHIPDPVVSDLVVVVRLVKRIV